MSTDNLTPIITTNPHDNGYDLVAGTDVTGPVVGRIYWDNAGYIDPGLVLRVGEADLHLPEDLNETVQALASHGYELDQLSRTELQHLITRNDPTVRTYVREEMRRLAAKLDDEKPVWCVGDPDPTPPQHEVGQWCSAVPYEGADDSCTWAVGHAEDMHVAGDGDQIVAVWPVEDGA